MDKNKAGMSHFIVFMGIDFTAWNKIAYQVVEFENTGKREIIQGEMHCCRNRYFGFFFKKKRMGGLGTLRAKTISVFACILMVILLPLKNVFVLFKYVSTFLTCLGIARSYQNRVGRCPTNP
jgi:hypothetical protein